MENYDSFAIGDFAVASMEATIASNQPELLPEGQGKVLSSGSTATSSSATTGTKRSRPCISGVRENFDRTTKPDTQENPESHVVCKICRHELSAKSEGGTGHFLRHITRCKTKQGLVVRQT